MTSMASQVMASAVQVTTKPHILVIGASYAGLSTVRNLIEMLSKRDPLPSPIPFPRPEPLPSQLPSISILDERDGFFHTMGAPLAHASTSFTERFWAQYHGMNKLKDVQVLRGTATSVNFADKILSFKETSENGYTHKSVSYDYLVAATGLKRQWPVVPRHHTKDKYISDTLSHIEGLEKAVGNIVVVGGGAVGIEMSSEIKHLHPSKKVILVHSRNELLSSEPLPAEFKQRTKAMLDASQVEVILGQRVTKHETSKAGSLDAHKLTLSTGEILDAEKVIFCTTKPQPNTEYLPEEALDDQGYVKIKPSMEFSSDIPHKGCHFAAGDIAVWPGIKRVGGAMIMGQCAAVNVIKSMALKEQENVNAQHTTNSKFVEVPPFPTMMTLAVGDDAISLGLQGEVESGKEIKCMQFGNDLGFSRVWEGLGMPGPE